MRVENKKIKMEGWSRALVMLCVICIWVAKYGLVKLSHWSVSAPEDITREFASYYQRLPGITSDYNEVTDNVVRDYLQFRTPWYCPPLSNAANLTWLLHDRKKGPLCSQRVNIPKTATLCNTLDTRWRFSFLHPRYIDSKFTTRRKCFVLSFCVSPSDMI